MDVEKILGISCRGCEVGGYQCHIIRKTDHRMQRYILPLKNQASDLGITGVKIKITAKSLDA